MEFLSSKNKSTEGRSMDSLNCLKKSLFADVGVESESQCGKEHLSQSLKDLLMDVDGGRRMEADTVHAITSPDWKSNMVADRRSSYAVRKRLVDTTADNWTGSPLKRCRQHSPESQSTDDVIAAVELLSSKSNAVADGSRDKCFPTIPGKHQDLESISPDTMKSVLNGDYNEDCDQFTVIDCRYPYEYEGGHIQGAVNLYTREAVNDFLLRTSQTTSGRHVLIFHCEFSSQRGPNMYRFLRSRDREVNKESYPRLNFPELYLLEGGYKAFYQLHQNTCTPSLYTPMMHKAHAQELRHFRVKSKSWTAGEKRRQRERVQLSFSEL